MLTDEHYQELVNEVQILQLINHRNKNQHRLLTWWKYFRLLLSLLKKIVLLQPEQPDKQLESPQQQQAIQKMFQKKIFTKCYYEFNGIIALGQFLLLGLALVSSLSKVHEILAPYKVVKFTDTVQDTPMDEELGEEVEIGVPENHDTEAMGHLVEKPKPSHTPKNLHQKAAPSKVYSLTPESDSKYPGENKGTGKKRKHDKDKKKKSKKAKTDIDLLFD